MERRSILIFHAGALGDFVLTWFLVGAVRRVWPGCEVTYVTHASKGRLAARFLGTAWSDMEVNGWHTLHGAAPALGVRAREILDGAGQAICFIGEDFAAKLCEVAPGMKVTSVAPIPAENWQRHVTELYVEQLAGDLPRAALEEALAELWREGVQTTRMEGSRALLHIGAGSLKKCWPIESFMEVAGQLRSAGHEVALMAGEAEIERTPERTMEQIRERYPMVCPRDYLELAEELLNARLLLTGDNGPGHLAGVLGCEVVSLFGPTRAEVWRPVGPRTEVVQGSTMQAIGVGQAMRFFDF